MDGQEQLPTNTKACFVAFIRHGERADFVEEKFDYDIAHDPILTPTGV